MVIKREIVTDFHAQVLGASNRFKDMPMQQVFTRDWGSSSCYVYDDTLTGVDLHVPLKFPLMEMAVSSANNRIFDLVLSGGSLM